MHAWTHATQYNPPPHTCSFDRCLSTLLVRVLWLSLGASDSMDLSVSSRMYAFWSLKPVCMNTRNTTTHDGCERVRDGDDDPLCSGR